MSLNWYPEINYSKCTDCMKCIDFCTHDVYSIKEGKPFVENKENCVEGCRGCEEVCPENAINHNVKCGCGEMKGNCNSNTKEDKPNKPSCSCGGNC